MPDKPSPFPKYETLRMPLKNFRHLGPLSDADIEWWISYGRHLQAAQKAFDNLTVLK